MDLRIIGIDASLSSTGFAVADCSVNPKYNSKYKEALFKLLTEKNYKDLSALDNCFMLVRGIEIKESKETSKLLAAARKRIREAEKEDKQPNLKDLLEEEYLSTKKITDQVDQIIFLIEEQEKDKQLTFIFIEDYSFLSHGSITQLAEMKGVLKTRMERYISVNTQMNGGVQQLFYLTANINAVKKVAARNGNAPKDLICEELTRFGFKYDTSKDDEADAVAITLASFYAIFHRLCPFEVPQGLKTKERNYLKSFVASLNTFGNRIGSREDLQSLL